MSTTSGEAERVGQAALVLPLLGGPFDGERFIASAPPPAVLQLSARHGGRDHYLLRVLACSAGPERAYVLRGISASSAAMAFDRLRRLPRDLPEPWQLHALRMQRAEPPDCPGCGRRSDCYATQPQTRPMRMALHCLDCGMLHATLEAVE